MTQEEPIEGIVIKLHPYRDADMILKVLTYSHGKLSILARGSRNEGSRHKHHFDLLDRGIFELKAGRGSLFSLSFFRSGKGFLDIRRSLDKLAIASLILESFDHLIPESRPQDDCDDSEDYFNCLQLGLEALNNSSELKESLKSAFLSIDFALERSGYGSFSQEHQPSSKSLMLLIEKVEQVTERELLSKRTIIELIRSLQKTTHLDQ